MSDVDPFDEGVPRGRYGRPLIHPAKRDGSPNLKAQLVEYDRASTVADALDDGNGLATWKVRHAALGVAVSPDLAAMAAALGRNLNTFTDADKTNLDAIIERAHDRSGGNEKADYGTAVHSLTEPGNTGDAITDEMARDVVSYLATIDEAGIEVDATEVFVVNDTLKTAGTFDHSYVFTRELVVKLDGDEVTIPAGTKVIGDKKTGSLHFDAHAIQLAIYARGKKYDHRTGERASLDVSPKWGVIAHVKREGAETTLYLVDLEDGWKGAQLAVEVRAYKLGSRRRLSAAFAKCAAPTADVDDTPADDPMPAPQPEPESPASATPDGQPLGDDGFPADLTIGGALGNLNDAGLHPSDAIIPQIEACADADALHALWLANRQAWQPVHTDAAKRRKTQLEAA